MPVYPDSPFVELAPDWVSEVLSDSTRQVDRVKKMRVYGRERVPHVWDVDPRARTLEVFRIDGDTYRLVAAHAGDERARLEPFDAIELELGALWGRREE